MAVYYIDPILGNEQNDGLTENTPKKDYHSLDLKGGDSVLFKCGTFIRGKLDNVDGEIGNPITYSYYGEGERPTFCGSIDILSDPSAWYEEGQNIWVTDAVPNEEACNFIFNNSDLCGTLCWEKDDLKEQGDFYDNQFGTRLFDKPMKPGHKIYMYSVKNPAEYYDHIELAVYGKRCLANNGIGVTFDGLRFINSGVHAIASSGASKCVKVLNCVFEHIGGCTWNAERRIRLGNAYECWNIAEDIEVSGCYFYNIYDSGVTHQGGKECEPAKNVHFDNNIFIKCGMGAYEQRDLLPLYATFSGNVCIAAGEGFSKQGEKQMPRLSEVWPMPMGHHIFLWRIVKPTQGGRLEIKNNIFAGAPLGASIYSIIYKSAEEQIDLEGNIYCSPDEDLLVNRLYGIDYKSFKEYADAGIEKNPECKKVDISKYLK